MKSIGTIILLAICSIHLQAQKPPLPLDAYGIWSRGGIDDIKHFDGFKGIRANYEWSDVQPSDSVHYDWSSYQKALIDAYENDLYIYVSILVGPDSPKWIYENGVPKVFTEGETKWTYYPYYLDPDYKRYFHKMIEQFALFMRSQPDHLTDRLAFVQLMIGCTGDVGPYKGSPIDPQYVISDTEWGNFNMATFEQFKIHFNDGDEGKKIPLLINGFAIHPESDPEEWAWVNNNIDPEIGFGIKGSAYMRGHHLTGEKEFIDTWEKYLVNSKGMQIFSRGEMDQTHTWPLFQINKPLAFYWAMLSGLNTGLSLWDISTSAIEYVSGSEQVQDAFRFFNKHAAQVFPSSAKAGYVIFHEGLNSENTTKFPVGTYGEATQGNEARYEAICQAYSDRGAKMDHTYAATKGQVWQRHDQTGYNDAGWSIEEGNYERWIEQINPEETSVGLFRVNGVIDKNSSIYDRFARSFEHASGKDVMYFKFHDETFSVREPEELTFHIIWLDKTAGSSWEFRYDNGEGGLVTGETFTGSGNGEWKTESIVLTDAIMQKNGPSGSDFALVNTDGLDDIFHGIEVDIVRAGDDLDSVVIDIPSAGEEFMIGDSIVVSASGYDLQGIARMRFRIDGKKSYIDDYIAPYSQTYYDLGLGDHLIEVLMKDSIGYWTEAEPVNIKVIPASDTVLITRPQNGDRVITGEDVTVGAFAYDYDGIAKLEFRVDEESVHIVDAEPYEYTFSGLSEGLHTFVVQMTDLSGNTLSSEGIEITVFNPPDSVSILSPADGDTFQQGEFVRVTTYCYDRDGIERIRFRLDNADNWDNVLSPPYEFTYSGLSVGSHLIEVQMKDVNGDRRLAEPLTIYVIATDKVSITSPSDGAFIPLGEDILVKAYCYDNDGIETVGFGVDLESYINITDPPYEFNFTGLNEGAHTFRVLMTDNEGNTLSSEQVTATVVPPDSVSITSPVNGDTIAMGEDILVTVSCHDNEGIENVGFRVDQGNFNIVDSPPYDYSFTGLNEGLHTLEARMTDLAGNTMLSEAVEIVIEDQSQGTGFEGKTHGGKMIHIYPTMVDQVMYWTANTVMEEIHIYSITGVKIMSQNLNNQGSIDLAKLDPGLYFLYFEYDNHLSGPQKIVKQ